jgi:uncharacterized protein (DUF1810 family)
MNQNDPYNLQRFVEAQRRCYGQVCSELKAGCKTSHWMWFIFPQWKGLGQSPIANLYAIASRRESVHLVSHWNRGLHRLLARWNSSAFQILLFDEPSRQDAQRL